MELDIKKLMGDMKIDVIQLQREMLTLYFGKEWLAVIEDMFIGDGTTLNIVGDIKKVIALYQKSGDFEPIQRGDLIPKDSVDIYKFFKKVPLNKVKGIIIFNDPKALASMMTEQEIEAVCNAGLFILPELLTINAYGDVDPIHKVWLSFTSDLLTKLSDHKILSIDGVNADCKSIINDFCSILNITITWP